MNDPGVLQWFATLGVGGVLAGGMFLVYRKDVKEMMESWRGQAQILIKVIQENTAAMQEMNIIIKVVKENLASLTAVNFERDIEKERIERLERLDRISKGYKQHDANG